MARARALPGDQPSDQSRAAQQRREIFRVPYERGLDSALAARGSGTRVLIDPLTHERRGGPSRRTRASAHVTDAAGTARVHNRVGWRHRKRGIRLRL